MFARNGSILADLNRTGLVVSIIGSHRRGRAEVLQFLTDHAHSGVHAPHPYGISIAVVHGEKHGVTAYLDVSARLHASGALLFDVTTAV